MNLFKKKPEVNITDIEVFSDLPEEHKRYVLQECVKPITNEITLSSVIYHCLNNLKGKTTVLNEIIKQATIKKTLK
jgi:hypothetical protein